MSDTPDLAEFEGLSAPRRRPCPVPDAVAKLTPDEATALKAALAEPADVITNVAIEKWCERRGVTLGHAWIRSHRKTTCTCFDA